MIKRQYWRASFVVSLCLILCGSVFAVASPFGEVVVLDYNGVFEKVMIMQEQMDEVIIASSNIGLSAVPYTANNSIAEQFNASPIFSSKSFDGGKRLRNENETLLIKRRLGYLRIIDKIAIKRSRVLSTERYKVLTLSEKQALEKAFEFVDFLKIDRETVSNVDIKKIVSDAGNNEEITHYAEREYL